MGPGSLEFYPDLCAAPIHTTIFEIIYIFKIQLSIFLFIIWTQFCNEGKNNTEVFYVPIINSYREFNWFWIIYADHIQINCDPNKFRKFQLGDYRNERGFFNSKIPNSENYSSRVEGLGNRVWVKSNPAVSLSSSQKINWFQCERGRFNLIDSGRNIASERLHL